MIDKQDGEEVMRETGGSTEKYGKGILYITNQRVCFESERDGLCLDLKYSQLFDWEMTENGVNIKSQLVPGGIDYFLANIPIDKIEIELECIKPKEGKLSTPQIIHYTLFYAYTNSKNCEEAHGYGWYRDEKNEFVHRFDEIRKKYSSQEEIDQRDSTRDAIEKKFVENGTGDAKLDQLMFESNEMWNAWKKNGEYNDKYDITSGRISRDERIKKAKMGITISLDQSIEGIREWIAQTEAKISELKEAGNTAELEKVIPTIWTGEPDEYGIMTPKTTCAPTGTIYTKLEHQKKYLKSVIREKEIMSKIKFDFDPQFRIYETMLHNILMEKLYAGEDISTCAPEIEKIPDHTIAAKARIEERRRKFNRGQT